MIGLLSPELLEASNGVLLCVLVLMIGGLISYLYFSLWTIGFFGVYRERKAAIALTVFLIGLASRTTVVWWMRHVVNHGIPEPWWAPFAPGLLSISTLVIVVGGICWLRVTTWRELPHWAWMVAAAIAVMLGIWISR